MKQPTQKIEITHKTIVFAVFFLLSLYLIYLIKDIIFLLFISLLFMIAVVPIVSQLEKLKIPRSISIIITYIVVIFLLGATFASIIPPLITQTAKLISQIPIPPSILADIKNLNINLQDIDIIANQLNSIPKVLGVIGSGVSVVVIIITVLVMSFYLLMEKKNLHKYLVWLFGSNKAEVRAEKFINKVEEKIGGWVRGQLILMFIVGLLTYIGLNLLNISYAIPLAIIAGILEILPNIGPTISAIPAIAVAYISSSPAMAGAVAALYILVQQLENTLIVPIVMKKAVGMNPIATIFLLMVGFRLGGIPGAALAIPIFIIIKVSLEEFYKIRG